MAATFIRVSIINNQRESSHTLGGVRDAVPGVQRSTACNESKLFQDSDDAPDLYSCLSAPNSKRLHNEWKEDMLLLLLVISAYCALLMLVWVLDNDAEDG